MHNNQRGSIAINIMLVLLLAVIAVLIYLLAGDGGTRNGRTIGTVSPVHTAPGPAKKMPAAALPAHGEFDDGLGLSLIHI